MQLTADMQIAVSADEAWQVVGTGFGEIARWAAPIVASSLDRERARGRCGHATSRASA